MESLQHISIQKGRPVKALRERPEIYYWNLDAWKAFWVLSDSRQMGFGIGPIPISEIRAYCEFIGIEDRAEQERLLYLIRAMDSIFVKHETKKVKS